MKSWEPRRVGVLILYVIVVMFSCRKVYVAVRAPFAERERRELAEAYMEALVPEPTPINVRKYVDVLICLEFCL